MAIAIVQSKLTSGTGNITAGGTGAQTLNANPTVGNLLVALCTSDKNYTLPAGWTRIQFITGNPSLLNYALAFYRVVQSGDTATNLPNISNTQSPTHWDVLLYEISGQDATTPIDASAKNTVAANGTQTTLTSGSITPTVNGDLIMMVVGLNGSLGTVSFSTSPATTGDTIDATDNSPATGGIAAMHGFQTTAAAITGTITSDTAWASNQASYPIIILAVKPGATSTTGTGATIQDHQTVSSSGIVPVVGSGASAQDHQRVAASGALTFAGTAASKQDKQTVAAIGTEKFSGTAASAQKKQTVSAAASLVFSGTASTAQDHQRVNGTAAEIFAATAATAQDHQRISASGLLTIRGVGASVQDHQRINAAGRTLYNATAATAQKRQTVSGLGGIPVTGLAAVHQAEQVITASGWWAPPAPKVHITLPITASMNLTLPITRTITLDLPLAQGP